MQALLIVGIVIITLVMVLFFQTQMQSQGHSKHSIIHRYHSMLPSFFSKRLGPSPVGDLYTPPLQDKMDRVLGLPTDPSLAPNLMSQLDIMNGNGIHASINPRVAASLLPIHVRPPMDESYKQVGILSRARSENEDGRLDASVDIIPLMGQQLNGDKWRYFTMLGGNLQTKLPIKKTDGKPCTSEYGCPELYDRDLVDVTGMGSKYSVDIYQNGTFFR